MAGIYIHIPFCKKACIYCDFHFSTNLTRTGEMVDAILKELDLRLEPWENETFSTIYFGGGTPSLLTFGQLSSILEKINQKLKLSENPEITLEANPDDLTPDKLENLKKAGINRLSIGIQTFNQAHLLWMNRSHTANQAEACLKNAMNNGFKNISADLIYGFSGLDEATLKSDLLHLINGGITHISAYTMTIEPKTVLAHHLKKGLYTEPPDEKAELHYRIICIALQEAGFQHYEVSNWAKPGFRSKHNSSYWGGIPYLGLGPSAHSYQNHVRSWNCRNNAKYIASIQNNELPFDSEKLSDKELLNEYFMTALRTAEGINLSSISTNHLSDAWFQEFEEMKNRGYLVEYHTNQYRIPEDKWLMSDFVIASFFVD